MMSIRDSLSEDHGVSIKWEDIVVNRDDEVDWFQLTSKKQTNCNCDVAIKNIMSFYV